MKTLLTTGLVALLAASGAGFAQPLDHDGARHGQLSPAQIEAIGQQLNKSPAASFAPVMTRAIASMDTDGKPVVKCHVEKAPLSFTPDHLRRTAAPEMQR